MFNIRKKCVKDTIKDIAKREGMSVNEVRNHYQQIIDEIRCSDDNPEAQKLYFKLFGNKTPSPEEFIYVLSKQTGKIKL